MAVLVQPLLNVTSAAQTPIVAATWARYVEIQEDGSGTGSGLKVTWPNGNVANYPPADQPIKIGSPTIASAPLVGAPPNYNNANGTGTLYCNVESMGANTVVRVTETN